MDVREAVPGRCELNVEEKEEDRLLVVGLRVEAMKIQPEDQDPDVQADLTV